MYSQQAVEGNEAQAEADEVALGEPDDEVHADPVEHHIDDLLKHVRLQDERAEVAPPRAHHLQLREDLALRAQIPRGHALAEEHQ